MNKNQQVADQCKAVAHMATTIAGMFTDFATMHTENSVPSLVETHGERSHRLMETLGDILNGMDAVTDEDDWIGPVFAKARDEFPLNP